jgi:hypothetical protein
MVSKTVAIREVIEAELLGVSKEYAQPKKEVHP